MSQRTSYSKPQKIKVDGLEYEVRTVTVWNDKGRSGTIDDSIPIINKVQYKPGPSLADPFPQFSDLADRTENKGTNNGWSFRPIAGPAFKRALVESGPNSLSSQLDSATQQQLSKDANVPIPRAQQALGSITTTKSNQALAADNQDPNAAAGGQNVAQAEQSGDRSVPAILDPQQLSSAIGKEVGTTRNEFPGAGGSEPLRYPINLRSDNQDVIKFMMVKYSPKKFAAETFGFSDREKAGSKNRNIIGTVVLPIPAGISDTNAVNWGSADMNAAQAAAAAAALGFIGSGTEGGTSALETSINNISNYSDEVKTAIKALFADAAVGTTGLLTRTTGQIINPNMELLFNSPSLRPFTFSFKMSARNPDEAKVILSIIRFFKQGMSPIRSESTLFLKSPHTFQLQYLHKKEEHRFLNKFKECALQSFNVNYTPEGQYATYPDGAMVSYEISMQFQELEPVFNDEYPNDNDASIGY